MFASTHSERLAGGHSRSVSLFSNMICSWICPHRLDGCYWFGYDSAVSAAGAVSAAAVSAPPSCGFDSSVTVIVPLILYVTSPPPLSLLSFMLSLENLLSREGVTEVSLLAVRQEGWPVWRLL